MSSRQDKEKSVNVQVLLRCRPFSSEEIRSNAPQVVTCNDFQREVAVTQTIAGKQFDRVFTFDKVFGPTAKQKDLYDQAIIPIVNEVLEGFNCTIFAYGQTGTGKTYTMEGECRRAKSGPKGQLPADAGVIPRAVKQIFDTLERQGTEYSVKVTFLELYNEEITDLLAPEEISKAALEDRQKKNLPLMEDGKGGVLIRGLEEEVVTNADEIFSLLERGSAKRRTAETLLNKQSSRSHSLFSITIHMKEATPEGEELIKCGKLNLVDLAGSENVSRSGAREGCAREVGEINKSLLTLGRVITALVEHLGHVPYRDSKLTRLLRESLGGRTKTCIIATVSPSAQCLEETMSTLHYVHRAKSIKNRPEVNQKMMKSTLIKDLYGEIDRLKAEVYAYAAREKVGVYIPKERYQQEENERKAMAEQIKKMTASLEANQKQINELQQKYNSELQHSAELSNLLSTTKEDLKQAQYNLTVKDYIISEQKKAENALTHQACVLRSDLEKFTCDNASLYSKINRGEKLSATDMSVVNTFQTDLASKLDILSSGLNSSIDQQNKHLKAVEDLCQSCVDSHDKVGYPVDERPMMGGVGMDRGIGYGARPEPPLPRDASSILYIEGLPANCTPRELSHIFRPFVMFREVRFVNKESRHPGGDPHVDNPAQATIALDALQGQMMGVVGMDRGMGYGARPCDASCALYIEGLPANLTPREVSTSLISGSCSPTSGNRVALRRSQQGRSQHGGFRQAPQPSQQHGRKKSSSKMWVDSMTSLFLTCYLEFSDSRKDENLTKIGKFKIIAEDMSKKLGIVLTEQQLKHRFAKLRDLYDVYISLQQGPPQSDAWLKKKKKKGLEFQAVISGEILPYLDLLKRTFKDAKA